MDVEGFQNTDYLQRYYASQALIGLLARGRLDYWLSADNKVSPEGTKQLAELAFDIAKGMVDEAEKR